MITNIIHKNVDIEVTHLNELAFLDDDIYPEQNFQIEEIKIIVGTKERIIQFKDLSEITKLEIEYLLQQEFEEEFYRWIKK